MLPDNIGGATRTVSWSWSRTSSVIKRADGHARRRQGVPVLYLLHRFREVLEYLERQNYWKFLQIWLSESPLPHQKQEGQFP